MIFHILTFISEDIDVDEGACILLPDGFNNYICAETTVANEVCELAKTKIGFNQSAVSKIIKRLELPANALTRDAIKSWIEKQRSK